LDKQLGAILGTPAQSRAAPKKTPTMSASTRRKIAATQKTRWAKLRREIPATRSGKPAANAKKKTMSPAARRKLSAKLKAYWAKKKAGNK
jgi:hypothetical protein